MSLSIRTPGSPPPPAWPPAIDPTRGAPRVRVLSISPTGGATGATFSARIALADGFDPLISFRVAEGVIGVEIPAAWPDRALWAEQVRVALLRAWPEHSAVAGPVPQPPPPVMSPESVAPEPPPSAVHHIARTRFHGDAMDALARIWSDTQSLPRTAAARRAAPALLAEVLGAIGQRIEAAEEARRAKLLSADFTVNVSEKQARELAELRAAAERFGELHRTMAGDLPALEAAEASARQALGARAAVLAERYAAHNATIFAAFAAAQPLIDAAQERAAMRIEHGHIAAAVRSAGLDVRDFLPAELAVTYRVTPERMGDDDALDWVLRAPGVAPAGEGPAPAWAHRIDRPGR